MSRVSTKGWGPCSLPTVYGAGLGPFGDPDIACPLDSTYSLTREPKNMALRLQAGVLGQDQLALSPEVAKGEGPGWRALHSSSYPCLPYRLPSMCRQVCTGLLQSPVSLEKTCYTPGEMSLDFLCQLLV
jgi:hypothetical protein